MLSDKVRVGERGDACDDNQIGRFGQFFDQCVTGVDVCVGRLRIGNICRIIEVSKRTFDVNEHGVVAVCVRKRLPHLIHTVCQHGRRDIKTLKLHSVRVYVCLLGSGGQDCFKRILLCVGCVRHRLRGALKLLRFVKIHAIRRIHDIAAQIADARKNEKAKQDCCQQRDQRNAPQRPLVAVRKNTHRVSASTLCFE